MHIVHNVYIAHIVHTVHIMHIVHIDHIVHLVHIVHIVHNVNIWFIRVYLCSLGLILTDVGDLGCRVLNLEKESNKHTNTHTYTHTHSDRGFLGCLEILWDMLNLGYWFWGVILGKKCFYNTR